MTFTEELHDGFAQKPRGEQLNRWGVETLRCASVLEGMRDALPPEAVPVLHDLFFEIGRLARDAERRP